MRRRFPLLCGAVAAGWLGMTAPFARAQVAAGESRVLVLPFAMQSGGGSEALGRAVQQDLFADLTQGTTARIAAPSSAPGAIDADGALTEAREAGASIVVFGQAQVSGAEVRLTGQVIDVATATPLGAIKATGPLDDLFHLEDTLAGQVMVALPRTLLKAQTLDGVQQPASAYVSEMAEPPARAVPLPVTSAVAVPPVVIDNDPAASPAGSYDYGPTPVYDYSICPVPAYPYGAPGCDLWPGGIYIGSGGYGSYGGYGYHGGGFQHYGYGHPGYDSHHQWDPHHWDHHSDGSYPRDGGHREYRGGPSRPSYLSSPSPHFSIGGFHTGSAGPGPIHSASGGEHAFSHSASSAGSHFGGSGLHSAGRESAPSQGGNAGGGFRSGGGFHSGGGGGAHR